MRPMYEHLFSRFTEEFKTSFEDPDIHLSYTDRQRIKGGKYADVGGRDSVCGKGPFREGQGPSKEHGF